MWLKSFFHKCFSGPSQQQRLSLTHPTTSIKTASKLPRIVIIGAGAAGLACATKLRELGFENIRILEAENRIGGRILTQYFGDNVIDLGAQWVHGEYNNVVYGMIKDQQWLQSSGKIYEEFECIRSNGETLSPELVSYLKEILRKIYDDCEDSLEVYEGSLGDYLNEHFQAVLNHPDMKNIDHQVASEFFESFKKVESSETSSGIHEVSAKGFKEYWQCPGEYLLNWKGKGYITFLRMLLGSDNDHFLGSWEDCIEFECHVDCIQWNRDDRIAVVMCNDGRQFEAEHVVITVSLGVLKHHMDSMFDPPLPIHKKNAIAGLGFGSVAKIFLEFDHCFWPVNWYGFTTLWINEDLKELHKTQFDWVEEIFGFYCVSHQPRVLLGWVVGPVVLKIENMPLAELTQGCMYVLNRFLRKWAIPEPISVVVTKWLSNPNFAGAYSFRSMLSEELGATAALLSEPLTLYVPVDNVFSDVCSDSSSSCSLVSDESFKPKPILLFAGEATSPHHFSTVHGAVESGHREAMRLLNYYGGKFNKIRYSLMPK